MKPRARQRRSVPSHSLPELVRRAHDWATVGPFRAGVVTAFAFAVLVYAATVSVGSATVAFAVALPFALIGTYAIDTAREWRDWLSSPDSPLAGAANGVGRDARTGTGTDTRAQLVRLRERYVEGEIDEATFERKLAVLLDTDTPEAARAHARRAADDAGGRSGGDDDGGRGDDGDGGHDAERARARDGDGDADVDRASTRR